MCGHGVRWSGPCWGWSLGYLLSYSKTVGMSRKSDKHESVSRNTGKDMQSHSATHFHEHALFVTLNSRLEDHFYLSVVSFHLTLSKSVLGWASSKAASMSNGYGRQSVSMYICASKSHKLMPVVCNSVGGYRTSQPLSNDSEKFKCRMQCCFFCDTSWFRIRFEQSLSKLDW